MERLPAAGLHPTIALGNRLGARQPPRGWSGRDQVRRPESQKPRITFQACKGICGPTGLRGLLAVSREKGGRMRRPVLIALAAAAMAAVLIPTGAASARTVGAQQVDQTSAPSTTSTQFQCTPAAVTPV